VTDNTINGGASVVALVEIDTSSGVSVDHNRLTDLNHFNVELDHSNDNTISSNTINQGDAGGVFLFSSDRNTLDHNRIGTSGGIVIEASNQNQVISNTLTGTTGIVVGPPIPLLDVAGPGVSDGNVISDNNITRGVNTSLNDTLVITDGVWIEPNHATNTVLRRNTADHNPGNGFKIESPSTIVNSNTAIGNGGHGFDAVAGVTSQHNVAAHNQTPPQCINVQCAPPH
jgi:parallel beta-helix repeat protein